MISVIPGNSNQLPEAQGRLVAEILLKLHTETQPFAVLVGAVVSAAMLQAPISLGYLAYDEGAGAWHLTALLDRSAQAVDLDALGVPLGPLALDRSSVIDAPAPRPLAQVLGTVWGFDACRRMEARFGAAGVLTAPLGPQTTTSGKLICFLHSPAADEALVALVLRHAAIAFGRTLQVSDGVDDGVQTPAAIMETLANETARSARYNRPLSVVYLLFHNQTEMSVSGPPMGRRIRRWDSLGRAGGEDHALVLVLPESRRQEARIVLERLGEHLGSARTGIAEAPDDGHSPERLLEVARARAIAPQPVWAVAAGANGAVWVREQLDAQRTPGNSVEVRCPRCLVRYTRPRESGAMISVDRMRELARWALATACPNHDEQFVVHGV